MFYSLDSPRLTAVFKIVDFSEAECVGHWLVFIEYWVGEAEDECTVDKLHSAAVQLLRGCFQLFVPMSPDSRR